MKITLAETCHLFSYGIQWEEIHKKDVNMACFQEIRKDGFY